jgi:hypothetical protein
LDGSPYPEELLSLGILPIRLSKSTLKSQISDFKFQNHQHGIGGGEGIRTPDPMVANHVLCQLSYTPFEISNFRFQISKCKTPFEVCKPPFGICSMKSEIPMVGLGRFELPTSPLSGVRSNQLSYRPAGLLPQNKGYKLSPVASIWFFAAPCLH